MSEYEETRYDIEAERARKMNLAKNIRVVQKECEGVQKVVANVLKEFPEGLKTTFSEDVMAANEWVKKKFDRYGKVNENDNERSLESMHNEISGIKREGEKILNKLNEDLTQKAPEIEKKLKKEYSNTESKFAGNIDLLKSWFGEAHVKNIENNTKEIQKPIKEKNYKKAESLIKDLNEKMDSNLREANNLEERHQKREYVMGALRKVGTEMGFKEVTKPAFKEPETKPMHERKRGSMEYVLDTRNQGKIDITISIDDKEANKISIKSEIFKKKCGGEFDKVSKILKTTYGIKTEFKPKTQGPDAPKVDDEGTAIDAGVSTSAAQS